MATSEEIAVLKMYAPKCNIKGCDNDCQIAWDSYGKINFDHCKDCHFAYVGKGFYIDEVVNGVTETEEPEIVTDWDQQQQAEQEDEIGKREERYLKMCIEMDEGQPNDNDSGWDY